MQTVFKGEGALAHLADILKDHKPQKVFLVTAKNAYAAWRPAMEEVLTAEFYHYNRCHSGLSCLHEAINEFNAQGCDFVIGIGGGSVMDVAKAVALCHGEAELDPAASLAPELRGVPKVMIPTTAGTGSEVTPFSVVYRDHKKYSLTHPQLVPEYAILDPQFLANMPAYIAACCGFDAIGQCIESAWSVHSTNESREYSFAGLKLALQSIEGFVKRGENGAAMLEAAHLSGRAISIAKTTAAHAVSYPLTSFYNVPHGHGVGLMVPRFFAFNEGVTAETCTDPRGVEHVRGVLAELRTAFGGAQGLIELLAKVDLGSLKQCGIKEGDIPHIAEHSFNPERMKNNPRAVDMNDMLALLREAW